MTDSPEKPDRGDLEPRRSDELLIEVVDEKTLREVHERQAARVRLLWNKRRFLFWGVICGLVIAVLFALVFPKSYESTADLMPPNQSSGLGAALMTALGGSGSSSGSGGGGLLGGSGGGLASMAEGALGMKTSGDLFIGILESATVQDDLIHEFDLSKVYGTRYIEKTRKALASHTDISEDSKSGIISITVTDHNPKRAAAMAQEYVRELNWVETHLNTTSAHRERVFLDHRLKQVKSQMEDAEKQFSQFASQKGAIDIPEQGKAMVEAGAELQGELIVAESELQSMRQIYTDNNVTVRSLQAQVNELKAQLQKLGGKGVNEKSTAEELYPSLRELPLLGVTYADLLRRVKVEEAVFELLTEQDEMAKVEEAKDTPSVQVLDPPQVPDHQSFPTLAISLIVGTALSLVFGCTWVLASSAWKATDAADPRKAVAIEVWQDVHSSMPWNTRNGSTKGGPGHWLRKRFRRGSQDTSDE